MERDTDGKYSEQADRASTLATLVDIGSRLYERGHRKSRTAATTPHHPLCMADRTLALYAHAGLW
ncbi:hypothetical protein GPZ77_34150 [Streptomyces sp. QHH-9511]|uniref:hypothetical protein n=1 Tax=Streptomyces sp. QHH-9511 TaxID=2684468 RepID=UPI001317B9C8|nr:hypothetical protein [Streptomyces sp. QHH-9511]QGZ52654.1 hypothetical protein GPZ77_34150 [Streptomyces sp. QHH-9511]